jgi:hypothetical protein
MPLLVSPVALAGCQGVKYEIGMYRLHANWQQRADLPDLAYTGYGDTQFRSNCVELIQMADGMLKYGLVNAIVMGGKQHERGVTCCRQRDCITGYHSGYRMFVND